MLALSESSLSLVSGGQERLTPALSIFLSRRLKSTEVGSYETEDLKRATAPRLAPRGQKGASTRLCCVTLECRPAGLVASAFAPVAPLPFLTFFDLFHLFDLLLTLLDVAIHICMHAPLASAFCTYMCDSSKPFFFFPSLLVARLTLIPGPSGRTRRFLLSTYLVGTYLFKRMYIHMYVRPYIVFRREIQAYEPA